MKRSFILFLCNQISYPYWRYNNLRPWPNDSIFYSSFSSIFDLKVERLLSVVEHMWPNGSIFRSTFLSTSQLVFTITNICPLNETLLRMLSLDLLDKVAKRLDFFLDFLLSKKSSEKSSRLARAV